jgi:iron complex outermembrane recepter protein
MNYRNKTLSASLVALTLTPIAHAQTTSPQPESKQPPIVVIGERDDYKTPSPSETAMKTDTPILLTPQSVQIIPRAVLDDQKVLNLRDAVRNAAGSGSDFGFNGSDLPMLILRGFPTVSMSARGPMSGSTSYYLNGTKVQGVPVNITNVESVEVIKGPNSVLYGRAEPGGMINVVERQTQAKPMFSFEQSLGSYQLSRTTLEAAGGLNSDASLKGRAAASYSKSGSNRDFVQDQLGAFSGTLTWQPSASTQATFKIDYSDQKYRNDYGIPALGNRPADFPLNRQYNDSPDLSSTKTTAYQLDLTQQLSSDWKLKAHFLRSDSKATELDITPYRIDLFTGDDCIASAGQMCRYYFSAKPGFDRSITQFNVDVVGEFSTGSLKHKLLLGVDSYNIKADTTSYFAAVPSVDLFNPQLGNSPRLDTTTASGSDTEDRSKWTGVYVQDQIALGAGVHLSLGVRHEKTSAIYGPPGTQANEQSFTSPRAGLVWEFTKGQTIYAQYQESVAANNGRDLAGQPVAAEQAKQVEIGHKLQSADGGLTSTVALYQLTKRNLANYVPTLAGFEIVAVGEARSRGLEWDISGRISPTLSLIGSYAYTDAVVTKDSFFEGKKLPNVARQSSSLWLRYTPLTAWTFGCGLFFQGQREGDQANTFEMPGYGRVDVMAAYRFPIGSTKASLQLNLNNLFNKRYYTGSHQFVQDWIAPGAPRSGLLTFRLEI